MKVTNNKILVGSLSKYFDDRLVLGKKAKYQSIVLYNIVLQNYNYALAQLEAGDARYNESVLNLAQKLDELRHKCPEVCLYKNKFALVTSNTAPAIDDNIITLPYSDDFQSVLRNEIIKNYFDAENDGISEIYIINKTDDLLLNVDGNPVQLNSVYSPSTTDFEVKFDKTTTQEFIVFNQDLMGSCGALIVQIQDEQQYNTLLNDGYFIEELNVFPSTTLTLQKLTGTGVVRQDIVVNTLNYFTTELNVLVRDNNINPLLSNTGDISIRFTETCEEIPQCNIQENNSVTIQHTETYQFTEQDFFPLTNNADYIKITSLGTEGTYKYSGGIITNADLPLILNTQTVSNLTYEGGATLGQTSSVIQFSRSFGNSLNYCDGSNEIEMIKLEIPDVPATIVIPPISLVANTPTEMLSTLIDATVTYLGTGTLTYSWNYISGPAGITIGVTNQEDLMVGGLTQGNSYTFELTVTTSFGLITTESITIPVTLANQAPEITVQGPIDLIMDAPTISTFTVVNNVSVIDLDNNITTIAWTQLSGPNSSIINNGNTISPTFTNLIVGTYQYQVTVTDATSLQDIDFLTVNVVQGNTEPTVTATGGTIVLPTDTFTSVVLVTDAQNNVVSEVWSQVSGPNTATIDQNLNTFSNLIEGTYIFNITVTDSFGASDNENITVIVTAALNLPPIVNAGSDATVVNGTQVTLSGTATDPDGTIASTEWTNISATGTFNIQSPNSLSTVVDNLKSGTYVFRLTAIDNSSNSSFDDVTITVQNDLDINVTQTGTILAPDPNYTIVAQGIDFDGIEEVILDTLSPNTSFPALASPTFSTTSAVAVAPFPSTLNLVCTVDNMNVDGVYTFSIKAKSAGAATYDVEKIVTITRQPLQEVTLAVVVDCNSTVGTSVITVWANTLSLSNGTLLYGDALGNTIYTDNTNTVYRQVGNSYVAGDPLSTTTISTDTVEISAFGEIINTITC